MNLREIFKRFLRNAAMILGSRVTFGLLNLATSALVVQSFGLAVLGIVLLLQVYARLFTDIVKFDSWQAVLSFGSKLQEAGEDDKMRSFLGFTLSVDLLGIGIGIVCAIIFAPLAASIFEWPPEVAAFAPFYVFSVLFMVQGTPSGVLRLVDRVDILAIQFALNATIRFVGVGLAVLLDGALIHLVLTWFVATIVSGMLPMIFAARELLKRNLLPAFDLNWRRASSEFDGIWRFLLFSNLSSSLSFIYFSGTVTFVGAFLGPAAAATLQIAQQFAVALSRPARILGPLISPELAKLAAMGDWVIFRRLIKRQLMIMGGILIVLGAILFAILGFVINTVYGAELMDDLWLFKVLIFSSLLTMATFSFEPAVLSINKPTMLLSLRGGAAVLYVLVSLVLLKDYGIYAFGYGFLASQAAYVTVFSILGARILKRQVSIQRGG